MNRCHIGIIVLGFAVGVSCSLSGRANADDRDDRAALWKELGLDARQKPAVGTGAQSKTNSELPGQDVPVQNTPSGQERDEAVDLSTAISEGDDPLEREVEVTYFSGSVDRGMWDIPVRLDFGGSFVSIGSFDLDDSNFYGWEGKFAVPLNQIAAKYDIPGLRFVFDVNYGRSNFQSISQDVDASSTGAGSSVILDPQGLTGGFGGGGLAFANVGGFADHRGVTGKGVYEEQLYTFGLSSVCIQKEHFSVSKSVALLYGNTKEEFHVSGSTGVVAGTPTVDYRYDNTLKTDRWGLQLGLDLEYEIGEIGGYPLSAFADAKVRVISNHADARSDASTTGLVNVRSINDQISDSWVDFGLVGGAGLTLKVNETTAVSLGFRAETWEISTLDMSAASPFTIEPVDRISFSVGFSVSTSY